MVRQHLDERVSFLSGCYIREKRGANIGTMDAFWYVVLRHKRRIATAKIQIIFVIQQGTDDFLKNN